MSILFACTGCGAKYKVSDALAGKKAQCKKCGVITKIPVPVSSSDEIGFRDDPPDRSNEPVLDSSTIAGTVHAMERSVHGEDDPYDPPPIFETEPAPHRPLLNPLPKVQMSELDALDFKGASHAGSSGRGSAASNYAPAEPWSLVIIVLFLVAIAFGIYHDYTTWPSLLPPVAPEFATVGGPPHAMLIMPRVVMLVSAFVVLGPLAAIGWLIACKVQNFRTPTNLYVRALAIAMLPLATIIALTSLPLDMTPAMAGMVSLACVPVAFLLLFYVHRQTINVAGIATGIATLLLVFGLVLTFMGASAVSQTMGDTYLQKREVLVNQKTQEKEQQALAAKEELRQKLLAAAAAATRPAVASATIVKQADSLLERVKALQIPAALATQTRESLTSAAETADSDLAGLKKVSPSLKQYGPIVDAIATMRKTAATLPSENPPTDLTQPIAATTDWTAKSGRHEVSVYEYNFVPPADVTVSIETDPATSGWHWKNSGDTVELIVKETSAPSADQKRPWVAPLNITQRSKTPMFAIDAGQNAVMDTGLIGRIPFTRITESPPAGTAGIKKVTYVTLDNGKWLAASFYGTAQEETDLADMDRSVRTLHKRSDSMAVVDPLNASELIARYPAAHGPAGQTILDMLKSKPGAEDAVIRAMGVAPDTAALEQFGPLLSAVATSHSVPLLWKIAPLEGSCSQSARDALRMLDPKNADDLSFAVMDLKSGHPDQMKHAVSVLANADVQKSKLFEVSRALANAMSTPGFVMETNGPDLEMALGKWINDDISHGLIAMLEADPGQSSDRKLAITALADTGNRKYAWAICRSVSKEPDLVMDTLINMGPTVEPEVDRLLSDPNAVARKSGAMILQEIGTAKSQLSLNAAIAQSGDDEFKDAAKEALNRIHEREKATTQPAK